jgi:predicted transcriptional regulator
MKMISLRELKDQYYGKITKQQFAEKMGVANSTMSKMMNGKYDCTFNSKLWMRLCKTVKDLHNFQLVSENKFVLESEKTTKVINRLQDEIKKKDKIIQNYEQIITELMSAVRVMSNAKEAVKNSKFVLSLYKQNSNENKF